MTSVNHGSAMPKEVLKYRKQFADDFGGLDGGVSLLRTVTHWADGQNESFWDGVTDPKNIVEAYRIVTVECGVDNITGLFEEIALAKEERPECEWLSWVEDRLKDLRKILPNV